MRKSIIVDSLSLIELIKELIKLRNSISSYPEQSGFNMAISGLAQVIIKMPELNINISVQEIKEK